MASCARSISCDINRSIDTGPGAEAGSEALEPGAESAMVINLFRRSRAGQAFRAAPCLRLPSTVRTKGDIRPCYRRPKPHMLEPGEWSARMRWLALAVIGSMMGVTQLTGCMRTGDGV